VTIPGRKYIGENAVKPGAVQGSTSVFMKVVIAGLLPGICFILGIFWGKG